MKLQLWDAGKINWDLYPCDCTVRFWQCWSPQQSQLSIMTLTALWITTLTVFKTLINCRARMHVVMVCKITNFDDIANYDPEEREILNKVRFQVILATYRWTSNFLVAYTKIVFNGPLILTHSLGIHVITGTPSPDGNKVGLELDF